MKTNPKKSKWTCKYDATIPDLDKQVLEDKKEAILAALKYAPVFWQLHKDSQNRNHYRAVAYSDRSMVYCQLVINDIKNLDHQTLQGRIMAGAFAKRDIP